MRRRDVFLALASTLSGCIGPIGGPETAGQPTRDPTPEPETREQPTRPSAPESTTGESPSERATRSASRTPRTVPERTTEADPADTTASPTPPEARRIAVETVEDDRLREVFGIAVDVWVRDRDVTGGETARVELALRTLTDTSRSLTYQQRHCGRNEFRATTDGSGLFLFPAGGTWTSDEFECPVVAGPNLRCGIPVVEQSVTVPATGTLTWRYDVLVPPGNLERGGCLVPGQYRFIRQFTGDGTTATLSFRLSVRDT